MTSLAMLHSKKRGERCGRLWRLLILAQRRYGRYLWRYFRGFIWRRQRRRANNGPMKGSANLRARINITFEEAVFGCEKGLEIVLKDECTTCRGTGAKPGTQPVTCPKCNGEGQIVYTQQSMFGMVRNVQTCRNAAERVKSSKRSVPPAAEPGIPHPEGRFRCLFRRALTVDRVSESAKGGGPGTNGGPRGDLLVEVNVARHPIFQRRI